MIKNCKYCGKEFNAKRSRYSFCSLKCAAMDRAGNPETINRMKESAKRRGSQPIATKECKFCHNTFILKDMRNVFCSTKCYCESIKKQEKVIIPKPQTERTKRTCLDCGKEIQRYGKSIRCGKCNGIAHRKENKSLVKCSQCGRDFMKKNKDIPRTQNHFCSKSCLVIFRSNAQRGENNPRYKGNRSLHEALRKLKIYRDWRASVYERDKYTCKICGTKKSPFEAHHLITVSEIIETFELKTIHDAHKCEILKDINNGITVCQPCHKNIHRSKGKRNEIKNNFIIPINSKFLHSSTAYLQDR